MPTITEFDVELSSLLEELSRVRHAHLRPLLSVTPMGNAFACEYGEPGLCPSGCDGLVGAVRAVHRAGLWVGGLRRAVSLDTHGRALLSGVGSDWDLVDPFAGHPAASGRPDLRIGWRQSGDRHQLWSLPRELRICA
ncbi:MAG TPA: hypothetical protein PLT68_00915 [Actinomycetota bacterium]|nr:hypothetical protein [Actinomycetota bacterium]